MIMSDIYHNGEMYTPRKNLQKAQNRIKKLEAELANNQLERIVMARNWRSQCLKSGEKKEQLKKKKRKRLRMTHI